jgi:hypothetical protein
MRTLCAILLLLLSGSSSAGELDTAVLDELAAQQRYKEIGSILRQSPKDDPQVLAWLRRHASEWHPPLLQHLSFLLLEEGSKKPTREIYQELVSVYSRAKTAFYIDRGDCKAITKQVRDWNDSMWILGTAVEGGLRPSPQAIFAWGSGSLEWEASVSPGRGGATPAPAIWFCGADNLVPDSERGIARAKRTQEIAQQLLGMLQSGAPPNPAVQGTLRDKAAQRP